jgi:hypothetical protein
MNKKTLGSLLVVLGASFTCAGTSSARSTPAMLGNTFGHQSHCLQIDFSTGAVTNVCTNFLVSITVGVPLDSSGLHTATITIKDSDFFPFRSFCLIRSSAKDRTGGGSTSLLTPSGPNVFEDLGGTVPVPANGMLWASCTLNPFATVTKVEHSPN